MRRNKLLVAVAIPVVGVLGAAGLARGAGAPASPFTVVNGSIRPATGTPVPASGTQASLWGNASSATTTVTGSGRVVIGAIGDNCQGWPTLEVWVDGVSVGRTTVVSHTQYGGYPLQRSVGAGTHTVKVALVNDYRDASCDRNAHLASVRMEAAAPGSTKPDASNTGVPAGTKLTVHNGDINITKDGTVIDGWDLHGFVRINASNVTIRNSIIRGGDAKKTGRAVIQNYDVHPNFHIYDSTILPDFPSLYLDGLDGAHFTAERVDISGVVDSIKVIGDDVTIRDSFLHGNRHYLNDPGHPDGVSHDDNIQFEGGTNFLAEHNTIEGAWNAAWMITQNWARSSNMRMIGNWIGGGGCTVNFSEKGKGPILDVLIQDNIFGTSRLANCGVIAPPTSRPTMVNNVFEGTNTPVTVRRGA
jgi:predicted xylan-binding protein with Ca-dependent carbohydrate-binding module